MELRLVMIDNESLMKSFPYGTLSKRLSHKRSLSKFRKNKMKPLDLPRIPTRILSNCSYLMIGSLLTILTFDIHESFFKKKSPKVHIEIVEIFTEKPDTIYSPNPASEPTKKSLDELKNNCSKLDLQYT